MNRFAFASAALLSLVACGTESSNEPPIVQSDLARDTTPDASPADIQALVAGNTAFAVDLYKSAASLQDRQDARPTNLFMSPHSISSALAMTYAGARGTTASQMADVFGFTTSVHAAQNALDLEIGSRGQGATSAEIPFRLTTANSIWGQEGKEFQSPFLDTLAVNYGAGLHVLDFSSDPNGSREVINGWVADRTNDKIADLLPDGSISDATRLVLTNAVYFSAAWAEPFLVDQTSDKSFLVGGSPVQVPTLAHGALETGYSEGEGWKAAEIPYDGKELSMVVVVPENLAEFEAALTPTVLEQVTASMSTRGVNLELPKFKFKAPLGLADFLKELGMVDAFAEGVADLSGIDNTHDLFVSDVIHEGFVAIDEKGTEAAAATAVVVNTDSAPNPATLHADRPFVFFIRDIETKEILFLGRVVDPR